MDVTDTFSFTAPPEVVFNSLTDPDRAGRWLPSGARLERLDPNRVRVTVGTASTEYEISAADDMRLSWRQLDAPHVSGTAQVEDGPVGGSRLHVVVATPTDGPDPERVRDLLGEAMRQLQRDVSDNFNAG